MSPKNRFSLPVVLVFPDDPEEHCGNFPDVCVHGRARSGTADAGRWAPR
jgi:hypothetical protein